MSDRPRPTQPAASAIGALSPPETAAGYGVHMIRPHLRDIPVATFPPGFGIRPLRTDEGPLWLAVERDAEEYLRLGDDAFEREFGADLASVPERCFLITAPGAAAVGTVSAWYYTWRGTEYGLVHWLAVRPAYQGRGLGKAGLSHALSVLSRWHDQALLGTQTKRLRAIRLYLDYGFEPDMEEAQAQARWAQVSARLDHPGLRRLGL